MTAKTKGRNGGNRPTLSEALDGNGKRATVPAKWQRVLQALLTGQSFNRFSAARELRDTCLNSTVSELNGRGVVIARTDEIVLGYCGIPTRCKRYWLDPSEREAAARLLARSDGSGGQEVA